MGKRRPRRGRRLLTIKAALTPLLDAPADTRFATSRPTAARPADERSRARLARGGLVCRPYLSAESMALLDQTRDQDNHQQQEQEEEVIELNAA